MSWRRPWSAGAHGPIPAPRPSGGSRGGSRAARGGGRRRSRRPRRRSCRPRWATSRRAPPSSRIPGTRAERLAGVREQLGAPNSFAATAAGVYGLLIDVNDERDQLEAELRERWAGLAASGFPERQRALTEPAQQPPAEPASEEATA